MNKWTARILRSIKMTTQTHSSLGMISELRFKLVLRFLANKMKIRNWSAGINYIRQIKPFLHDNKTYPVKKCRKLSQRDDIPSPDWAQCIITHVYDPWWVHITIDYKLPKSTDLVYFVHHNIPEYNTVPEILGGAASRSSLINPSSLSFSKYLLSNYLCSTVQETKEIPWVNDGKSIPDHFLATVTNSEWVFWSFVVFAAVVGVKY